MTPAKIKRTRETPLPEEMRAQFLRDGALSIQRFEVDLSDGTGYSVLLGREPLHDMQPRWHLSIAHTRRLPEWRHIAELAHELRPGVVFVLGIPPKSWWINVHEFCLHLWETADAPLIESWRLEGRGDKPS
jgi:hypothetical protein